MVENRALKLLKFQLDLKLNGEEGDMSTFVLNGEWALLGMQKNTHI